MNSHKSNLDKAVQHEGQAWIFYEKKDFKNALAECDTAIALDSTRPNPYWIKGVILAQSDQNAEAQKLFQKVLILDPNHINAHNSYGLLLLENPKSIEQGIEYFLKAIQLDQRFWKAHYNLGIAFQMKGLNVEAMKQYYAAFLIKPSLKTFESLAISFVAAYPKTLGYLLAVFFLLAFVIQKPFGLIFTIVLMTYFGLYIKYALRVKEYRKFVYGASFAAVILIIHIYVILMMPS